VEHQAFFCLNAEEQYWKAAAERKVEKKTVKNLGSEEARGHF